MRVVAAVIRKDGKILLVRRAPLERLAGFWEFPGGKVEAGEGDEIALRREIAEELAIDISVGKYLASSGDEALTLVAYLCDWLSGVECLSVHDRAEWLSIEAISLKQLAPLDVPLLNALKEQELS